MAGPMPSPCSGLISPAASPDQQHVAGGRRGAGAAHPQPAADDRSRAARPGRGRRAAQQRAEPGQVVAQRRPAAGACPCRRRCRRSPARRRRGTASRSRGRSATARASSRTSSGSGTSAGHVGPDREAPQRGGRVEHPGQPGDRAERAVRADDHVAGQAPAVAGDQRRAPGRRVPLHLGDPGPHRSAPACSAASRSASSKAHPRDHDPVTRVACGR